MSFDSRLMQAVADHRTAWATAVADAVMRAGTTPWVLAACAAVGACMVYVGAHWFTDVLAGWLLGGAIGLAGGRASRWPRRSDATPATRRTPAAESR